MLFLSLLLKMNFQQIPPPCRPPNQLEPLLAKFLHIPSSRLSDVSAPTQLLRRKPFLMSVAFQHHGVPWCPFEQLEDALLHTTCWGSSHHVFSPFQCLLCRVREMNSRSHCRASDNTGHRVRAQFLPLNPMFISYQAEQF